ncbi:MAG: hemolysin family protein [Clostridium sp.]|nr:hemolysin family protein [Clostridium sp.]MDD6179821.1 hemolysin family protein [Clostridium sp.]
METSDVAQLIIIIVLIFLSGFFSSAETAFSTLNRVRMRNLEEEGSKKAARVNKILESYSKMLSAILIGNNIVNLTASSLTTAFVIGVCGNAYIGIGTGILTIVVLLGGEIIPKTWANLNSEKLALAYSSVIYALMKVMTPVIFIVDLLSNGILKLLHVDPNKKMDTITESELKTYVDVSHEDGQIESDERKMIYNIFEFSDTCVKDIMIPRTNMVTVNADESVNDLIKVFHESMYTRIPVYQEDKDSMIGFVNIKDLFIARISGQKNITLKSLLREAYYTYEYKKNADLLLEMREKSMNVAFVLNEYGSTVGMVTLEDLLEELVGEIRDEYDEDEKELIQKIDDRSYLIEGSMNLSDINDSIGTSLNSDDYDSIGGIIIGQLDRLPEDNESVVLADGTTLQVKGIDQNRILHVLLTLPEPKEEETDE